MDYLFTHKGWILKKYGDEQGGHILALVEQLRKLKQGHTYFLDELEGEYGAFQSNGAVDPGTFRALLNTIDTDSTKAHTFLLIGGDDIIPFVEVPNPVHDDDGVVLSDIPYASKGDDFLIPQRSIGRIPGSIDGEGDALEQVLERTVHYHEILKGFGESFGYSASVWEHASREVFRIVGDPDTLRLAPPLSSEEIEKEWLRRRILYFNLHGSKDTPNWYGQRSGSDPVAFSEFPVAIKPGNVPGLERSCVFSEACYGAWIGEKTTDESMALTFMARGCIAFVGSTAIAYGPIAPPSGEADLLGKFFFEYVLRNIPFGESLRQAKIDFARTMIRQQGFLDEDDRKTLLEFHLYGDPALALK